ncbi:unnamed protein product [Closterium sp. Naga37s-1]|nr:unnamed protein product [Closterium sp. Naga37s-1]
MLRFRFPSVPTSPLSSSPCLFLLLILSLSPSLPPSLSPSLPLPLPPSLALSLSSSLPLFLSPSLPLFLSPSLPLSLSSSAPLSLSPSLPLSLSSSLLLHILLSLPYLNPMPPPRGMPPSHASLHAITITPHAFVNAATPLHLPWPACPHRSRLGNNQLSGAIPPHIGTLTALREL